MSVDHLDPDIARITNVNSAIVFQKIRGFVKYHTAEKTNFHEGQYWSYNSYKGFVKLMPYLTQRQVRTAIDKLVDANLIITGCFNKFKNDRTVWYTLHPDFGLTLKSHQESWTDFEVTSTCDTEVTPACDTEVTPLPKETSEDLNIHQEGLFELKPEKLKTDPEEVFAKLWKQVYALVPKDKKTYFTKSIALKRFLKIVNRKKDPISPTRIANAVLHFYADVSQTKDDRRYMKAMQYVIGDEMFREFLHLGAFDEKASSEPTLDDLWQVYAKRYRKTRKFDATWCAHSRDTPKEFRKYFPDEDYEKLGWGNP